MAYTDEDITVLLETIKDSDLKGKKLTDAVNSATESLQNSETNIDGILKFFPKIDDKKERVIAARIGAMVLCYQWYHDAKPIGNKCIINLDDSDLYFMSHKAVGCDWKCRSKITLRHAAGCNYYTKI